jgi:signal transduction histidine kinase
MALARSNPPLRGERSGRHAGRGGGIRQAALLDEARGGLVRLLERRGRRLDGHEEAGAASAMLRPSAGALVVRPPRWAPGASNIDTPGGRHLVVESHWTCLRQPDGVPRAILTMSRDVTQERQTEAQLLQKQRLETIGMVAGGIAHDLNNVLAPLVLGIGSLRRKITDEHGVRLLQTMDSTAQRGAEILQQVLSFPRGTTAAGRCIGE